MKKSAVKKITALSLKSTPLTPLAPIQLRNVTSHMKYATSSTSHRA